MSQWACCQVRAHIIDSTSSAPTAHHQYLAATGIATTARRTTTQAAREECPDGKDCEVTVTMTLSGRGRSAMCLKTSVTA